MASRKSQPKGFWQVQLAEQQVSGLSRREYCRRHGLKLHQFNYQLKRSRKSEGKASGSAFARVLVGEPLAAKAEAFSARLNLGGGISLDLDSRTDPRWLSGLLRELGGAS